MAGAPDERLQLGDDGLVREPASRKREVGRRAPVERAEASDALGPEALGPAAGLPRELLELFPRRGARRDETGYVQTVSTSYEDVLTISTPEVVDLNLTLAGVGSRFVSAIVDTAIQGALVIALNIVLVRTDGFGAIEEGGGLAAAVYAIANFLVIWGYDVLWEVLGGGRTPGKRLNGLRVVRAEGQPVTFVSSSIRNVLRFVDLLPGAYLVGIVSILVTRKNQRLGDIAAGTLVVRERRAADTAIGERG